MGSRKITVRESAADSIAEIAWFIESKGMIATAEKFTDDVYDFIEKLSDPILTHANCRDPERNMMGMKCKPFRKKYTVVFIESSEEVIVCEFISSKLIKW